MLKREKVPDQGIPKTVMVCGIRRKLQRISSNRWRVYLGDVALGMLICHRLTGEWSVWFLERNVRANTLEEVIKKSEPVILGLFKKLGKALNYDVEETK